MPLLFPGAKEARQDDQGRQAGGTNEGVARGQEANSLGYNMSKRKSKKKTTMEVVDVVECEGLGYAVQDYMSADSIEDPGLAAAWQRAKDALDEINSILNKEMDKERDEGIDWEEEERKGYLPAEE